MILKMQSLGYLLPLIFLGGSSCSFNEIAFLTSLLEVEFQHVARLVNGFGDSLAKQGWGGLLI